MILSLVLSLVAGIVPALPASEAAPPVVQVRRYNLTPETTHGVGCVEPCLCPWTFGSPVAGTFELRLLGSDPVFEWYEVSSLSWTVPWGDSEVLGCGRYTVRREAALTQRLELDLRFPDEWLHLDSGWQPGDGGFPGRLDLAISTNTECFAHGFEVHAVLQEPPEGFGFLCEAAGAAVSLRWDFPGPSVPAGFRVLRDGEPVADLGPEGREYREEAPAGEHLYAVYAILAGPPPAGDGAPRVFIGSCVCRRRGGEPLRTGRL